VIALKTKRPHAPSRPPAKTRKRHDPEPEYNPAPVTKELQMSEQFAPWITDPDELVIMTPDGNAPNGPLARDTLRTPPPRTLRFNGPSSADLNPVAAAFLF
jgi:hypothetical protein